jgi:hypothetical protein
MDLPGWRTCQPFQFAGENKAERFFATKCANICASAVSPGNERVAVGGSRRNGAAFATECAKICTFAVELRTKIGSYLVASCCAIVRH